MNERNLRRFAALLTDFFLISIVYSVLMNILPDAWLNPSGGGLPWSFAWMSEGFVLVSLGYFVGCDMLNMGESLGKDIMGLQTRGVDGGRLDLRSRFVRTLLKGLSLILWPLAFLAFFWKEKGLTLQDYVLKSSVIRTRRFTPSH